MMTTDSPTARRVVLLETDERAGLVAELSAVCAGEGVSLEIVTGSGHVIITFDADAPTLTALVLRLEDVPGVRTAHSYTVARRRAA